MEKLTKCVLHSPFQLTNAAQLAGHDPLIFARVTMPRDSVSEFLQGCGTGRKRLTEATRLDVQDSLDAGGRHVPWWPRELEGSSQVAYTEGGSWHRVIFVEDTSVSQVNVYLEAGKL